MTARQHLANLERDEFVSFSEERQRLGRPLHLFFLTEKGEASFLPDFDRLAAYLVQAVCDLESSGDRRAYTRRENHTLVRQDCRPVYQPIRTASARADAQGARPRHRRHSAAREGGFAEWRQSADGYEILDYNCLYRKLTHPVFRAVPLASAHSAGAAQPPSGMARTGARGSAALSLLGERSRRIRRGVAITPSRAHI